MNWLINLLKFSNNSLLKLIFTFSRISKSDKSNSVSIHIRRNRFVEPQYFKDRGGEPKKDMRLDVSVLGKNFQ